MQTIVKKKKYLTAHMMLNRPRRAIDEVDMLRRCNGEIDPVRKFELMGIGESAKYLKVSTRSLQRWHDRGVLMAVINFENNRKQYMYAHLWVFKRLWLDEKENCT